MKKKTKKKKKKKKHADVLIHLKCVKMSFVEIEDIWLFQCKIDIYFTEWTPKVVFSRVAEPRVKLLLLVFMSEIKIDLILKKSNFLFLLCFKIAIVKFIQMRRQSRQRNSFFYSRFTLNLMLPACLMDMILVVNTVCNSKIAWNFSTLKRAQEIGQERMPKGGFGGLTSRAIIIWRWRF